MNQNAHVEDLQFGPLQAPVPSGRRRDDAATITIEDLAIAMGRAMPPAPDKGWWDRNGGTVFHIAGLALAAFVTYTAMEVKIAVLTSDLAHVQAEVTTLRNEFRAELSSLRADINASNDKLSDKLDRLRGQS